VHLTPGTLRRAVAYAESRGLDHVTAFGDFWSSGFVLEDRFANWQGEPFDGGAYAVSVHRRAPGLV